MWRLLESDLGDSPHLYEVITDFYDCKLYLDMECNRSPNYGSDMDDVLVSLSSVVTKKVGVYSVIVLDSSDSQRYSFQFTFSSVIRRKNVDFLEEVQSWAYMAKFQIRLLGGAMGSCVDIHPYKRNRQIRMFRCSKFRAMLYLRNIY